jgi:hypothetical protein
VLSVISELYQTFVFANVLLLIWFGEFFILPLISHHKLMLLICSKIGSARWIKN